MRKYIVLSSLVILTACETGGSNLISNYKKQTSDVPDTPQQFTTISFDATPDDARQYNSSVTGMATVLDVSDRLIEIYERSGIDYSGLSEAELGYSEPLFDGIMGEIYNNMSAEKKRKLKEAMFAAGSKGYIHMGMADPYSINGALLKLPDAVKWINAVYYVESNGAIAQKLDPNEIDNIHTQTDLQNYMASVDFGLLDGRQGALDVLWNTFTPNYDTGYVGYWVSPNGGWYQRYENSNVFEGDGDKVFITTYGGDINGAKLTYSDFGFADYAGAGTRELFATVEPVSWDPVAIDPKLKPDDTAWNFKGVAVGLYTKTGNFDNNGYFVQKRTNNATLHVDAHNNFTAYMPFSEDGWYDVEAQVRPGGSTIMFSNYNGTDGDRLIGDNGDTDVIVPTNGYNHDTAFYGEYKLSHPKEVVGIVDWHNASHPEEKFQAAYGMVKQE